MSDGNNMEDDGAKRNSDLGEKRFHSETSLHHMALEEEERTDNDPGVFNVLPISSRRDSAEMFRPRQRAFSQPFLAVTTAAAARAMRKRKSVAGVEVFNMQRPNSNSDEVFTPRRRTVSQPGPVVSTATSARAARRKPQRNVMYADQHKNVANAKDGEDKFSFRLMLPNSPQSIDSGTATPIGGRSSPLPTGGFPNGGGDVKSLNGYRLYASNGDLRSTGTPRKRSVTEVQSMHSMRSVETHAPPPTAPEDKTKMTNNYLTLMGSVMYAIFLVTVGVVVFISDPFLKEWSISPIYCLYLVGVGLFYLIFLLIDIRVYMNKTISNEKVKEMHIENYEDYYRKQEFELGGNGDRTSNDGFKTPVPPPPPAMLKQVNHNYCFSHGRHAGSFYLKMGAAAFALGHMVHSVLLLTTQLSYIVNDGYEDCLDYPQIVLDFLYPVYSFIQLFFIFKYSNVIILRWKALANFGFMHFIGSSLCFWVWTIVREIVLSLTNYAHSRNSSDGDYRTIRSANESSSVPNGSRFDLSDLLDENCQGMPAINTIYQNFSPYLFPFSVEYNILIVGVFYIIWNNIGQCVNDDDDDVSSIYSLDTTCKVQSEANGYSSNFVIHADCHASNRGIFGGLVIIVMTVALVILGFIFSNIDIPEFVRTGYVIADATKLALHIIMLVAVVIAYNRTRTLDVNQHPISLLDDILLFICIPAFFMEMLFTVIATINITNIIMCTDVVVMCVQIIIQTSFLVDGLRRCSNTRRLRRSKPGREVVMFLLISNVAMWIFNTFSYKSPDSVDERYEYYGKVLWSILGHISLPLIMFYRFHSSVCLADIWKSAYEPGVDH